MRLILGPSAGCGGTLNLTSTETRNVVPPEIYSEQLHCEWTVTSPADYTVQIVIQNVQLPQCQNNTSCRFVEVHLNCRTPLC